MLATMALPVLALLGGAPAPAPPVAAAPAPATRGDAQIKWSAPTRFVIGRPFRVSVRIEAPAEGAAVADWLLTPSAFTLNGKAIAPRAAKEVFELAPGGVLTLELDLATMLEGSEAFTGEDFDLGYDRLDERNPRLIYGRIKGFGLSGPYANYNSFDWVAQAAAGAFSVTGDPAAPPMHAGATMSDSGM